MIIKMCGNNVSQKQKKCKLFTAVSCSLLHKSLAFENMRNFKAFSIVSSSNMLLRPSQCRHVASPSSVREKGDTSCCLSFSSFKCERDQCFGSVWTGAGALRRHWTRLWRRPLFSLPPAKSHFWDFQEMNRKWPKDSLTPDDDLSSVC